MLLLWAVRPAKSDGYQPIQDFEYSSDCRKSGKYEEPLYHPINRFSIRGDTTIQVLERYLTIRSIAVPSAALARGCEHITLPFLTFGAQIMRFNNIFRRSHENLFVVFRAIKVAKYFIRQSPLTSKNAYCHVCRQRTYLKRTYVHKYHHPPK